MMGRGMPVGGTDVVFALVLVCLVVGSWPMGQGGVRSFFAHVPRTANATLHLVRRFRFLPGDLFIAHCRRLYGPLPVFSSRNFYEGISRGGAGFAAMVNVGHSEKIRRNGPLLGNRSTAQARLHLGSFQGDSVGTDERRAPLRQDRQGEFVGIYASVRSYERLDNVDQGQVL